ncbi:hypothetical protein [Leucobacter massiliensis]|uniref:hypothetical protein n=1 Tax=Leucobacter massiliensis TaxID=1686285 RepID=UPI0011B27A23|nr:hypothetical protein [Leucobacter massiliensis]
MRTLKQIKREARAIATGAASGITCKEKQSLQGFWIADRLNSHLDGYQIQFKLPYEKEGSGWWFANCPIYLTREEFELYQNSDTSDWK